jgi:hypothetical protein
MLFIDWQAVEAIATLRTKAEVIIDDKLVSYMGIVIFRQAFFKSRTTNPSTYRN